MSRVFVDANVLLYAQNLQSPHYSWAIAILESLSTHRQGVITPFVLNEIHYFILKKINSQVARTCISQILSLPNLLLMDFPIDPKGIKSICRLSTKYTLKTFDAYHAYYCQMLKIKLIATLDSDFDKLPFLERYIIKSKL